MATNGNGSKLTVGIGLFIALTFAGIGSSFVLGYQNAASCAALEAKTTAIERDAQRTQQALTRIEDKLDRLIERR